MSDSYVRVIKWFNKRGCNIIVGKEDITHLNVVFLKNLLKVGDDDDPELFGYYLIKDKEIKKIQPYIKHRINTKKYDYFIGTYQP